MVQYTKEAGISKNQSIGQKSIFNWILQHPQVVVSPIANDYLKLSTDGQVEPQLDTKLLFHVSVRELHNSMVGPPEEGGLKEARYTDNNIIISDSNLCNILPPQLNNMTLQYKVMCGFECCVSAKSVHYYLLTWSVRRLKHLKYRSHNVQNRRSDEISSRIFETYMNALQPHGYNI